MNITTIISGARNNGNTNQLTSKVVEGIKHKTIDLNDLVIAPICDLRHSNESYKKSDDDYNQLVELFMESDVLIFSTPIYYYGMAASMKNMIDRLSQAIRDDNYPKFKEAIAQTKIFVVAVGGDDPKIKGLPMIQQFSYICSFLNLSFEGYILGEGNRPGDIFDDVESIMKADLLNHKLRTLF